METTSERGWGKCARRVRNALPVLAITWLLSTPVLAAAQPAGGGGSTGTLSPEGPAGALALEGYVGVTRYFGAQASASIGGVTVPDAGVVEALRLGMRVGARFVLATPRLSLEWLATLGLTSGSSRVRFERFVASTSVLEWELMPGLRLRYAFVPEVAMTAELSMGFLRRGVSTLAVAPLDEVATSSVRRSTAQVRAALGVTLAPVRQLRFFFEPFAVQAPTGGGMELSPSGQVGAAYVF